MIIIKCKNNDYIQPIFHLAKAFFPDEEIIQQIDKEQEPQLQLILDGGSCFSLVDGDFPEVGKEEFVRVNGGECDYCLTKSASHKLELLKKVYTTLADYTNKTLPWGILTGVRPTKLAMSLLFKNEESKLADAIGQEEKQKSESIVQVLCEKYLLSKEKAELVVDVAKREKKLLEALDLEEGFSLYVSIPFCPSICSYCSFSSGELDQWKDRVDEYVEVLCQEIADLGQKIKRNLSETEGFTNAKHLNTIYIGGGTPTTLSVNQLSRLLHTIKTSFLMDKLVEYTVEAGRPDTITREKLSLFKEYGVTRISINPQSMNQKTLDKIGRRHTVDDVKKSFHLAREEGFDNINMDLIIGLPEEGMSQVESTIRQIEQLKPDALTIHTLAKKRGANIQLALPDDATTIAVEEMLNFCYERAFKMDLLPYYLYRQKNIAGNFENVGFATVDKVGIYNILIIEELQNIFGVGVGAITKLVEKKKIRRLSNTKDIKKYIETFGEKIEHA